jgi:excinuclease ABC subunit B
VAILDADKEGFLRNERSLIQTIGRASRNEHGAVIMYADSVTDSMKAAIDETARRRAIQIKYNKEHGITPKTIIKPVRDAISITKSSSDAGKKDDFVESDFEQMSTKDQKNMLARLTDEMREAAKKLDFEQAATLRDTIMELKAQIS